MFNFSEERSGLVLYALSERKNPNRKTYEIANPYVPFCDRNFVILIQAGRKRWQNKEPALFNVWISWREKEKLSVITILNNYFKNITKKN